MSVTTSQQLNYDQLADALGGSHAISTVGAHLPSTNPKTISADVTDQELQTAIDTAAAQFVDYQANRDTIQQNAKQAHQNNQTYLNIQAPTQAQVIAQVAALTRQMNNVLRIVANDYTGTN